MGKQTKDNDKKAVDNQARHEKKNEIAEKNRKSGKNQYSERPDHL